MNMLPRVERVLLLAAALFGLIAFLALVTPARVSNAEIAPVGIKARASKAAARNFDASSADAIIDGNIFSASRKAPPRRFNPAEPDEPASAPPVENAEVSADDEEAVPHLFGIVIGPVGATALLRLDRESPDAQIYREGDRGGRYRIVKINERSVILDGPSGRIELRLPRPDERAP